MIINPGTSGLAQNVKSRTSALKSNTSKVVKSVRMSSCSQNEY